MKIYSLPFLVLTFLVSLHPAKGEHCYLPELNGDWVLRSWIGQGSGNPRSDSACAVDSKRSYCLGGSFQGLARFGSNYLNSQALTDAYVAKYDRKEQLVWVRQIHHAVARGLGVDRSDALFLTGSFNHDTEIGPTRLERHGQEDSFVARFDTDGNVLWVRTAAGRDRRHLVRATGAAVDPAGNCFVVGDLGVNWGPVAFGETTVMPQGDRDMFIVKYAPDGTVLWARRDGGNNIQAMGAATDAEGNLFLTGVLVRDVTFSGTAVSVGQPSDMFLAKYDAEGRFLWARAPGGPPQRLGLRVAADGGGNPHVVGLFKDTRQFGSVTVTNESDSHENVFLAKYRSDGVFQWVRQFRNGDFDFSNVVDVHADRIASGQAKPVAGATAPALTGAAGGVATVPGVSQAANHDGGRASSALPAPVLAWRSEGIHLVLYWSRQFADCALEGSASLVPFPVWENVENVPQPTGDQVVVKVPIKEAMRFYRLRRP